MYGMLDTGTRICITTYAFLTPIVNDRIPLIIENGQKMGFSFGSGNL